MRTSSVVAIFLLAFLTGGCAATDAESPAPLPVSEPAAVGMSGEALDRIAPAMQRFVDEGIVSGVITMVARQGRLVHWDAVGFRNLASRDSLERDDVARICSMTKPVTSVGIMMLVEDGALSLDDPVGTHLPELAGLRVHTSGGLVPPARPVTIADLLSHTSGMTYGVFGQTPVDSMYLAEDVFSGDLQNLVAEVGGLPLLGHPGEVWNYGVSTDVLGRVIEVVSGEPLDVFMERRIFEQLGMDDTGFRVRSGSSGRLMTLYRPAEDGTIEPTSESVCSDPVDPVLLSGGGGLFSTASDYVRFAQMLLNGGELYGVRLLREETVDLMRANRLPEELMPVRIGPDFVRPGYGFGLGFSVLTDEDATPEPDNDGVYRWLGYASTYFWIDPEEQLIGIALSQLEPGIRPEIEFEFQTLVYEALEN